MRSILASLAFAVGALFSLGAHAQFQHVVPMCGNPPTPCTASNPLPTGRLCDLHVKYDASTSGSTKLITAVAAQRTYICGVVINVGGVATNVGLVEGTGTNCNGSVVALMPTYQLAAGGNTGFYAPSWGGMKSSVAVDVCITSSAANPVQADVWYTQQVP